MAKGIKKSLGRRSYGGKPYDANNSFVKKMATKVTDFIPQRSWISKWFNSSENNGGTNDNENAEEDVEEEVQPPVSKRPRIRMDVMHPPGTFSIRGRGKETLNDNHSRSDHFSHVNETSEEFAEPPVAGPSGVRRFVSSTPAVPTDMRSSNSQRSELNALIPSRNIRASNGVDDNSESSESTSGCSSLIPQTNRQEAPTNSTYNTNLASRKRMIDEKLSFTNHLQSPRCLFLESGSRDSLSSRRPSFNASMMTNNAVDRASSLSSPFYSGNVTFGGANALSHYKPSRSLFGSGNEFQLKVPRRTNVQVKPTSSECVDSSGMSQTAKRILEAMEYFSSPISDAKKIPVKNATPGSASGRKRLRDEEVQGGTSRVGLRHLTRELSVPTVPEMLKLRRRQKLQDTTVAARKIVSAMSGPPIASTARPAAAAATEEYQLRTDRDETPKFHGKLRAKLKKCSEDETPAPSVSLPRISLPITSLPSFEPPPKYAKPPRPAIDETPKSDGASKETFKFASPIKIREAAWNLKSINNFSFSKPLSAEETKNLDLSREANDTARTLSVDSNSAIFGSLEPAAAAPNFAWSGSSTAPRLKVKTKPKVKSENGAAARESFELKSGSVMDVLGAKSGTATASAVAPQRGSSITNLNAKSPPEIWECAECYIKNDASEKICAACKASRPAASGEKIPPVTSALPSSDPQAPGDGFGAKFKMTSDQWECQSCLVRNKCSESRCACCATPKPGGKSATAPAPSTTSAAFAPAKSSLMDKFKPPEGSWECSGCMLRNPSVVITCLCCKAAKPSSLKVSPSKANTDAENATEKASEPNSLKILEKFKPPASSWVCSSCLVRNTETASACVCCSTPKPGNESAKLTEQPAVKSAWDEKFLKPKDRWSCDTCLVQNKSEATECAACGGLKPGANAKPAAPQFSFGVPSSSTSLSFGVAGTNERLNETAKTSSNGFGLGAKSSGAATDSAAGKFTFGMPKGSEIAAKTTETKSMGFVFAAPKTTGEQLGDFKFESGKNAESKSDEKKAAAATFTFGLPKTVDENAKGPESKSIFGGPATAANGKPHFVFGIPKSESTATETAKSTPKISFGVSSDDGAVRKTSAFPAQATASKESGKREGFPAKPSGEPASSISSPLATPAPAAAITASNSVQKSALFAFSEPKSKLTSEASIVHTFGQSSASNPPTASSTFAIAGPKPGDVAPASTPSPFGVATISTPSQSLGGAPVDGKPGVPSVFGSVEKKPTSSFFDMPGGDKKPSAFGALEQKSPMFGAAVENKPTTAFGLKEKPAGGPIFDSPAVGASVAPTSQQQQQLFGSTSATPVFGSGAVLSFGVSGTTSETPSIFAAAKPNNAPAPANPGLFTFGASTSQPAAATTAAPAAFSFTGNATPASAPSKSLFTFGASAGTATAQPSECFGASATGATGAFGTGAAVNPAPSPFSFNAPPKQDPPSFGQAPAAIPNMFGTQSTAPSIGAQASQPAATGFSFGAAAPAPATGVFSFGGGMSQPASAPSTGFNFNAPSSSPAMAFDPNTRPSFNFTGGSAPTAFNATPQPATTRKIKKAVRRMPQR